MFEKIGMSTNNPEINPRVGRFSITPEEREKMSPAELERLEAKIELANNRISEGEDEEVVIEGDAELASLMEQRALIAATEKKFDEVEPVEAHAFGKQLDEELASEEGEDERIAA